MFNVKQLKINKFIKYIWQLISVAQLLHLRYPSYDPVIYKSDIIH